MLVSAEFRPHFGWATLLQQFRVPFTYSKRRMSPGAVLKFLSYAFSATPAFEFLGVPDSRLSSTGIQHLEQVCLSDRVTILLS